MPVGNEDAVEFAGESDDEIGELLRAAVDVEGEALADPLDFELRRLRHGRH